MGLRVIGIMRIRIVLTLGLGVLACRHAQTHDVGAHDPPAPTGGSHGTGEPRGTRPPDPVKPGGHASTTTTPAVARIGPIRRAAPFVFVPHTETATLERLAKTLRTAVLGPTPELRVELGCPDGVRVVDREKVQRLPLGKAEARSAVIDPATQWIAVELHAGGVTVFSRARFDRIGTWAGSNPVALGPGLLLVRDECRWLGVDPSQPHDPPRVLADDVCGEVIHVDAAKRRFTIAETSRESAGTRALVQVGFSAETSRIELPTDPPLGSLAISADGEILCGVVGAAHEKSVLKCRRLEGGAFERIAQGVVGPLRFAADAPRLAFTVAVADGAMDLHLADFEQRFVRKLGRVHHHRFAFLPGGERLVGYEGGRGMVFELDSGLQVPFGSHDDDWVGIVPLPGTHDAFLATRLRSKCADLVRIDLPKNDA